MNKKTKMLALLGMGLAMMPPDQHDVLMGMEEKPVVKTPPQKKPPSGTKEYFFNGNGEFSTDHMRKIECVFKCYAINDKNAIRKFKNRHNDTNQPI